MVQKIKLDLTHSVNLGSIFIDIITKKKENKQDVPLRSELAKPEFQHTSNILVHHYLILLFVLFLPTFMSHRATQVSYQHFLRTVILLAFKLVFSGQCVFLNFVL